ncbi:hypothetical protein VHEMI05299 [[Torrubiella] hemipterigena]|uniref:Ubiquitin carboxyl-terminal hydrolase 19 n=1 Tax=[Torrubiella] hemipterigena TaxID=1531966 RepID=A0A0A1TIC3_9HYPO|nr:hypothetical protein VHEMI05299 [[Torrubiella] hemipterigena]
MDPAYSLSREDLYNLQMEVKQVQYAQTNHAERISRLEKRQTDDSAIKSAWNSPFPGVLSTTPQHGPVQIPHNDVFDDLDEQGEELLGSLHLGPAEEEPVRRGAASRANSVRFDESALHGSSWSAAANQSNRHSGDFGSIRSGAGLMMERTLSHKSDGRHSSAGHSIHSHHSVASGRASSVGLDADDDDDSFAVPEPPVSLYVLGSVPSLTRCWLTLNFAHATLLYADICSGAQKSTIAQWLLEDLALIDDVERDVDGNPRIKLDVYFAEAVVTQRNSQPESPGSLVPSITVLFEVVGGNPPEGKKPIGVFIGSDALRAHSADILFSQNTMALYGNNRERVRVPFVRPDDESIFRHITTSNNRPEKPKLNASAAPFVFADTSAVSDTEAQSDSLEQSTEEHQVSEPISPTATHAQPKKSIPMEGTADTAGTETIRRASNDRPPRKSEISKRDVANAIWSPWRQNGANGGERENGSISGYQPPLPRGRNMKVLKTGKSTQGTSKGEGRRKSQTSTAGDGTNGGNKWEQKRGPSISRDTKHRETSQETAPEQPRASNPIGGASAFAWMTPGVKGSKGAATSE